MNYLKTYFQGLNSNSITNLKKAREIFAKHFKISISYAFYWKLVRRLGVKRKKLIRLNSNKNSEKTLEERKIFAKKMQKIISSDLRIIKIDECGFNLHNSINFGYNFKGKPAYKHVGGKGKNTSLITAIDNKQVIGSMFFHGSVKSQDFCYFISKIVQKLQKEGNNINNFVFQFDNAKSHYYSFSENFIPNLNYVKMPPYSPQLNHIELFFGFIKRQLKFKYFSSKFKLIEYVIKILKKDNSNVIERFYYHSFKYLRLAMQKEKFLD